MLLRKKTVLFLFLGLFLSSVIVCIAEDADDDSEECCSTGEGWIFDNCVPSAEDDVNAECTKIGIDCCKKYQKQKDESCKKGMEIAKKTNNCDNIEDDEAASCCNHCSLGLVLSSGNAANCGSSPGPETECCLYAVSQQQEITTPFREPEESSTSPMADLTTVSGANNRPTLNACELEGDDLCAHKCIPVGASYRCQCKSGYKLWSDNHSCRKMEVNRCQKSNSCDHICTDTGDEILCSCRPGYELMDDNTSCIDIDECALQADNCSPGQQCVNTVGSYKCASEKADQTKPKQSCPLGFVFNSLKQVCDDDDECQSNPCPPGLKCVNTVGSFSCGFAPEEPPPPPVAPSAASRPQVDVEAESLCPTGFRMDKELDDCKDIDECAESLDDCNRLSQYCLNTRGTFICYDKASRVTCPVGFKRNAKAECEDIDECYENPDICTPESVCINEPGSYNCKARSSLRSPPPPPPQPPLPQRPEEPPVRPTPPPARPSPPPVPTRPHVVQTRPPTTVRRPPNQRSCPAGYRKADNGGCADIDECAENRHNCDVYQDCVNVMGGHRCVCKKGFELNVITRACEDVNECQRNELNTCSESQRCDNTIGSYVCMRYISCGTGYTLNSLSSKCEDDNECFLGTHNCHQLGPQYECLNLPGTYRCIRRPQTTTTTTTTSTTLDPNEYEYYYPDIENPTAEVPETPLLEAENPRQKPEDPRQRPEDPRQRPIDPRQSPEDPRRQPEDPRQRPEDPRQRPEDPRQRPEDPRQRPDDPRQRPEDPRQRPEDPRQRPEDPIQRPEDPRLRPEDPRQRPEDPRQRPEDPRLRPEDPRQRPEDPRQRPEDPRLRPEDPRQTRPEYPQQPPYQRPSYPSPPPFLPTRTPIEETTTPRRPYQKPAGIPDDRYAEETKDNNSIEEGTTTPPPSTGSFHYPSDKQHEYRPDYPSNSKEQDVQRPNIYYSQPRPQQPGVEDPKYTTIHEPKEIPGTLVGETDLEGNVMVNTNDLKENTWTRVVPGAMRCLNGYVLDTNGKCADIDECRTGRHRCDPNSEVCFNVPGDYTCICAPGFLKDKASFGRCIRKDDINYLPPSPRVHPVWVPTPKKECDSGFQLDMTSNECYDIDECSDGIPRCAANEYCLNTMGGYRCQCLQGYEHQAGRCVPLPQSVTPMHPKPTPVVRVTNPPRHNFCSWGYTFENNRCVDVDECSTGKHDCLHNQKCVNIPGGYLCHCAPGHRHIPNVGCEDVDECAESKGQTCSPYSTCINTIGSFECKCKPGFTTSPMSKTLCTDVDECQENGGLGPCHQKCVNIWGSFRCACHTGYKLNPDNRTCTDIDECAEPVRRLCVGTCENIPGSYRCSCPNGYRMGADKRSCIDIDECDTGELTCGPDEVCQNTRGGARCSSIACPPGYLRDAGSRHRCRRPPGVCSIHDYNCLHRPETYSFNFITFVSKLYIPTGPRPQVDLFTMKGPNWEQSILHFELRLVDARAPPNIPVGDISYFKMTPSPQQALVSLVRPLIGPQDIHLELSMELYRLGKFEGTATAKIFIYVSEYEF